MIIVQTSKAKEAHDQPMRLFNAKFDTRCNRSLSATKLNNPTVTHSDPNHNPKCPDMYNAKLKYS